jgi:2-polyprenyl-6-methoxyphenol hydroxylase-like FAD-dependent oxidoreductase
LQTSLVEECENQGITIFFNSPCIGLDTRRNSVSFLQAGSHMITIQSDLILGCDGVHSAVREHLSRQIAISVTKETSPHCYRYVDVPYIKGVIEESALQVFFVDSGKFFMTYPKGNGEYGGVIYFSKYFAESLTSNEKVQTWLKDSFPLFYDHIKDQFKGDSLDHAYLKFVKCLSISKTRSR